MAEVKVSCRHISHFSMLHYYLKRSGGETTDVVRHFEYTDYGGDVVLEKESWYVVMLESGNNEGFNVSAPPSHILITPYQMGECFCCHHIKGGVMRAIIKDTHKIEGFTIIFHSNCNHHLCVHFIALPRSSSLPPRHHSPSPPSRGDGGQMVF